MDNSKKDKVQNYKSSIGSAETKEEEISRAKRIKIFKWQATTALICLLARAVFLYHYVKYAIQAQRRSVSEASSPPTLTSSLFLLMEIAFTLYRIPPQYLESIIYAPKARFRPRLRLESNQVPTVDVLIFYCGEAIDVLRDTVRAACSQDYPKDRFRVLVLDDSDKISQQVNALVSEYPNLLYTTRGSRNKAWQKAGNINHGLKYAKHLPDGPNELVAGLDVDMIPEKDWLRRLVPHLILDTNVGIVGPISGFYNLPHGDPLGQLLQVEQVMNVRYLRKDFGGVGLGTGTGWVARRTALDSIDGFAVDAITEDFLTCIDLQEAGWKIVLVDETVEWGLVPDSFKGNAKQYSRWYTAVLSFHRALSGSPKRPRHQRAYKLLAIFSTLSSTTALTLCYVILPLLVLSTRPLISFRDEQHFKVLLRLGLVDFLAQSAHGFLEAWVTNFMIFSWHELSHLWHVPLLVPAFLYHWIPFLTKLSIPANLLPANSTANKSSEDMYKSPWKRLKALALEAHLATHLFVLSVCAAGMAGAVRGVWDHRGNTHELFRYFLMRVGWPPALFFWTSAFRNALKPFWYALFVPPREEREHFLARDPKTKVAHPTEKAKDQRHRRVQEWHLVFVLVYFISVAILF